MKQLLTTILVSVVFASLGQPVATVKEYEKVFKTYPFSDPDPIPRVDKIYPYFRFDGYTDKPVEKAWKVVELENDFISVMILPEIGGKIWAATEKSTGKPFLYYNHVVKFRDIAMRGPWTSGGIEANYGIIGHTPNCSTPVDYMTRSNPDGSVSCFIGTLDLLTQTYWTIEINVPKDKGYFTTRSFWSNTTSLEQPYYTWMNAGIKAAGDLEFVYPGIKYLGHDGSNKSWKIHDNGTDISYYERNNFGPYKSYHVFGKYTDFFGGFWHKENFGMGRYAAHDEKAGKKIWIWGLSRQGMIWENLLSDTDGQYVEVQSGRLFNQTDHTSMITPFKHRGFAPYSSDAWTEYWFPVKGTQGFVSANPIGAMNVRIRQGRVRVDISPLQNMNEKLVISQGSSRIYEKDVALRILQPFSDSVSIGPQEHIVVTLGDRLIQYSTDPSKDVLSRPVESPKDFDWNSIQGLYIEGKEFIRERQYVAAESKLQQCLLKDPNYLPALTNLAMVHYRNMEYAKAFALLMHALSIDTYDPMANFYYGLTSLALGKKTDARDGFDIAAMDPSHRVAAYTELSRMDLVDNRPDRAIHYASKAIEGNAGHVEALQLLTVAYRLQKNKGKTDETLMALKQLNPLSHFAGFENYLSMPTPDSKSAFIKSIKNELAVESYLELALWYHHLGQMKEARMVLDLSPTNAEIAFWQAFLEQRLTGSAEKSLERAIHAPATGVFPFRSESAEVFAWATSVTSNWKPKYFLGLIYWSKNQTAKARELFAACGNQPDFAPMYAARAELIRETALTDLQRATELDPGQWRYVKILAQYYFGTRQHAEALRVLEDYDRRKPNDFRIRLLVAKSFLLLENYKSCNQVLAKTNVLPYEGSTEGHALYREAWLMQAVAQIKARKYADALAMIGKARLYPANLGVGMPYDADIDSRVEYFLEGLCQEGLKKADKAKMAFDKVIAQTQWPAGNGTLIVAWALRKNGQADKGESQLKQWTQQAPPDAMAAWSLAAFKKTDLPEFPTSGSNLIQSIYLLNP